MNDILLVDKIDPSDFSGEYFEFFFIIGDISNIKVTKKVIDVLNKFEEVDEKNALYMRNGFKIFIKTQDVPRLIKNMVMENILIYGVYKVYDSGY